MLVTDHEFLSVHACCWTQEGANVSETSTKLHMFYCLYFDLCGLLFSLHKNAQDILVEVRSVVLDHIRHDLQKLAHLRRFHDVTHPLGQERPSLVLEIIQLAAILTEHPKELQSGAKCFHNVFKLK